MMAGIEISNHRCPDGATHRVYPNFLANMHFIIQSPFAALPPQILPPKDCDCGGSLGHAIRRHRAHQQKQIDLWEAAGYRGNKTAVMLYAFSGSIVQADGSLSGQAQYNGDASTKPPTMAIQSSPRP